MNIHSSFKKWFSSFSELVKKAFINWKEDDASSMAAALSYYAIFSIPAFSLLIIDLAGKFLGEDAIQGKISKELKYILGKSAAQEIQTLIVNARLEKNDFLNTVIGWTFLLIAATGVFVQLEKSLDKIWKIRSNKKDSILKALISRLQSLGFIIFLGFMMTSSLFFSNFLTLYEDFFQKVSFGHAQKLINSIDFLTSVVIMTFVFSLLYKILPNIKLSFKVIWPGALLTSVLFNIGKFIIKFYFSTFEPASNFGKASSVILVMIWVFITSLIIIFGAEFTRLLVLKYSNVPEPNRFGKIKEK